MNIKLTDSEKSQLLSIPDLKWHESNYWVSQYIEKQTIIFLHEKVKNVDKKYYELQLYEDTTKPHGNIIVTLINCKTEVYIPLVLNIYDKRFIR